MLCVVTPQHKQDESMLSFDAETSVEGIYGEARFAAEERGFYFSLQKVAV